MATRSGAATAQQVFSLLPTFMPTLIDGHECLKLRLNQATKGDPRLALKVRTQLVVQGIKV